MMPIFSGKLHGFMRLTRKTIFMRTDRIENSETQTARNAEETPRVAQRQSGLSLKVVKKIFSPEELELLSREQHTTPP